MKIEKYMYQYFDEDKEISDNVVSGTKTSDEDVSADSVVSCDDTLHMLTHKCSLESILKLPLPIKKAQPLPSQTTAVRVLTSKENLKLIAAGRERKERSCTKEVGKESRKRTKKEKQRAGS